MHLIGGKRGSGRTSKLFHMAYNSSQNGIKPWVVVLNKSLKNLFEEKYPILEGRIISQGQIDKLRGQRGPVYVDNLDFMDDYTLQVLSMCDVRGITFESK